MVELDSDGVTMHGFPDVVQAQVSHFLRQVLVERSQVVQQHLGLPLDFDVNLLIVWLGSLVDVGLLREDE